MKAIPATLVLLFASAAYGDTVLAVSIAPVAMSNQQTVTLSFDYDVTSQSIFGVDLSVVGQYDNDVPTVFSSTPTFAQFGNGGLQVLNFMDQFGNLLQLDVFNNAAPAIGSLGPGTYLAPLDIVCNPNSTLTCEGAFNAGFATATDPPAPSTPEPGVLSLLTVALLGLVVLKLKTTQEALGPISPPGCPAWINHPVRCVRFRL